MGARLWGALSSDGHATVPRLRPPRSSGSRDRLWSLVWPSNSSEERAWGFLGPRDPGVFSHGAAAWLVYCCLPTQGGKGKGERSTGAPVSRCGGPCLPALWLELSTLKDCSHPQGGWNCLSWGESAVIFPSLPRHISSDTRAPLSQTWPFPNQIRQRADGTVPFQGPGLTRPPAAEVFESLKKVRTPPSSTVQEALQCFFLGGARGEGFNLLLG